MTRGKPFINTVPEGIEDGSGEPTAVAPAPAAVPVPGATKRKRKPLPAKEKPQGRPRKLLTAQELVEEEIRLKAKYPHLVKDSLLNATKDTPISGLTNEEVYKFRHKRSCLIKCVCSHERRIATSDLAQVTLCPTCTRDARNQRKRARRILARAAK